MAKFYDRSTNPPNVPPGVLTRSPLNIKNFKGDAPISFYAASQALTFASRSNDVLNVETLQPGFRAPYWIDEIRMSFYTEVELEARGAGQNSNGYSGIIKAKFSTGSYAFSKQTHAIGIHGPVWGGIDANGNSYRPDTGQSINNDETNMYTYGYVRMPLPKPLYMPAGDAVQCYVELDSSYATAVSNDPTVYFQLTYIGRLIAPGTPAPLVRNVPWISSHASLWSALNQSSHTTDEFRNPFTKTLNVQRLTMRAYDEDPTQIIESGDTNLPAGTTQGWVGIQMDDSQGYVIAKNALGDGYVPIGEVFDTARRAWTFNRSLGPREQLNMQLATRGIDAFGSPGLHIIIGMIGYREESL